MISDFPEIWMDIQDDEGQDISCLRYWYLSGCYVEQGSWNTYGDGLGLGFEYGYGLGYGNGIRYGLGCGCGLVYGYGYGYYL